MLGYPQFCLRLIYCTIWGFPNSCIYAHTKQVMNKNWGRRIRGIQGVHRKKKTPTMRLEQYIQYVKRPQLEKQSTSNHYFSNILIKSICIQISIFPHFHHFKTINCDGYTLYAQMPPMFQWIGCTEKLYPQNNTCFDGASAFPIWKIQENPIIIIIIIID